MSEQTAIIDSYGNIDSNKISYPLDLLNIAGNK